MPLTCTRCGDRTSVGTRCCPRAEPLTSFRAARTVLAGVTLALLTMLVTLLALALPRLLDEVTAPTPGPVGTSPPSTGGAPTATGPRPVPPLGPRTGLATTPS